MIDIYTPEGAVEFLGILGGFIRFIEVVISEWIKFRDKKK